jgi:hypothetical protein
MAFYVHRISGLVYGQHRREVVFLFCDDPESIVDAELTFNGLKDKDKREMLNKFDWWARGNDSPSHWFHGFDDADRKYCFVFKRRKSKARYRYYGFLIHPTPITNPRYELCVLTNHAQKNTEQTDPRETNFVNAIRVRADVIAAVHREFPEKKEGKNATSHIN